MARRKAQGYNNGAPGCSFRRIDGASSLQPWLDTGMEADRQYSYRENGVNVKLRERAAVTGDRCE